MSDKKWGFVENYAHRHLPFKWHHAGFTLYDPNPLTKTSFRPSSIPSYRDDFQPLATTYGERPQGTRWAMSCYGCHRNPAWDETLRLPRNPFPGKPSREMKYLREFADLAEQVRCFPPSTPRPARPRPSRPFSAPPGRPQSSRRAHQAKVKELGAMCDTKWGFNTNYGHRTLPFKWQSSNGFHFYEESPLTKKNFRPAHLPALREDLMNKWGFLQSICSGLLLGYGCHRDLIWDESLRMPRNPFAGKPNREMAYIKEVPLSTFLGTDPETPRCHGLSSGAMQRAAPSWRHQVLDKSAEELAQMMKLFEEPRWL
eukprot:Skav219611  [mRNA]  locus=scaffold628:90422:95968:- [translate_table: standard]